MKDVLICDTILSTISPRILREFISQYMCEAKPTTLKRPSPGDGFENHMYCL